MRREQLDRVAAHAEGAAHEVDVVAPVVQGDEVGDELVARQPLAHLHGERHRRVRLDRADAVDARHRGDDDHVVALQQRARRRVAHAVDLLVDRGFLLDVGVGARHVRLRLVVVVVGDEVLDRVVGEEALELAVELRRQRLVGREDQRRALRALDHLGHGEGLARAGDAEQHLAALVLVGAGDQLGDGRRLVALGRVLRLELEADAAFGLVRALRPVRHEHRLVAGDERMRRQHRLAVEQLLGAGRALLRLGQQRVEILADRRPAHGRQRPLLAQRRQRLVRLFQVIARPARRLRAQLHLATGRQPGVSGPTPKSACGASLMPGGGRLLGPLASALAARAHFRRAGGRLERRRRRLAGPDARGARLGDLVWVLGGRGHAPNMASPAAPLKLCRSCRHGRERTLTRSPQCCPIEAAIGRNTAYRAACNEGSQYALEYMRARARRARRGVALSRSRACGAAAPCVELFTSPFCSSCPPADELFVKLARQPGLITLVMPVDSWDRPGRKDALAKPSFTERQSGLRRRAQRGHALHAAGDDQRRGRG